MMKINIKPNLRQFLTGKIKTQKKDFQKNSVSNQKNNLIKQINSHTNSNKNIGKFSLLNSIKDKDNKKLAKLIEENNNNNNNIYNFNNNSFLKEAQNEFNKFRKSKTTEKVKGNNILINHQDNKSNKNKKVMIKQNTGNIKKYNFSVSKIPKYDSSAFNQVIKYYTIKSESKTIQIEELSTYLRPIRSLLGFANKVKVQNSTSSSININNHRDHKIKNFLNNNNNSKENICDQNQNKNSIAIENSKTNDEQNDKIREDYYVEDDKKDISPEKNKDIQNNINLNKNTMNTNTNVSNEIENNNNINNSNSNFILNNNQINTSLIKNCVFNNISHTQRKNKFTPIPYNIVIDKINNSKIGSIMNEINNKDLNNVNVNINNNGVNTKNSSQIDTQISTNNNANNNNSQTQAFNQFRPRKMNLPKTGINLSSTQFKKNKILQNILNKRKQKK